MKVSFFKYVQDYYKLTNKDLPVECSSKYSVDQGNRISGIILGYSFIFVSWTIFLIDSTIFEDLINKIIIFSCAVIFGLSFIMKSKFNIFKIIKLHYLFNRKNEGYTKIIYDYFLNGEESNNNLVNYLKSKYKKICILKINTAIIIYVRDKKYKHKIVINRKMIYLFINKKTKKIIQDYKLTNRELYKLIISNFEV